MTLKYSPVTDLRSVKQKIQNLFHCIVSPFLFQKNVMETEAWRLPREVINNLENLESNLILCFFHDSQSNTHA
jgi:hypothetical protein